MIGALIELYDFMLESKVAGLPRLGWREKQVGLVVSLRLDGSVSNISPRKKVYEVLPELIKSTSSGVEPNFLFCYPKYLMVEKFRNAFTDRHRAYLASKSDAAPFLKLLERWDSSVLNPEGGTKVSFEGEEIVGAVVFQIEGVGFLHEIPSLVDMWPKMAGEWQGIETVKGYSSVDGKWSDLTTFHMACGANIKGAKAQAKLGAVNIDCYESYGIKKGLGCPMTIEQSVKLAAAILYMTRFRNRQSVSIITSPQAKNGVGFLTGSIRTDKVEKKIVAWGDPLASQVLMTPFGAVDDSDDEEINSAIKKIRTGTLSGVLGTRNKVHCLMISAPSGGRLTIDDYWDSDLEHVARNTIEWNRKMALFGYGPMSYYRFSKTLSGIDKESLNDTEAHTYRSVFSTSFSGTNMPLRFRGMAFRRVLSLLSRGDNPWGAARILKATMIEAGIQFKEGMMKMEEESVAFKFGRILKAIDGFEYRAVNSGSGKKTDSQTLSKMMPMCMSNPKASTDRLMRKAESYGKMLSRKGLAPVLPILISKYDIADVFRELPQTFGVSEKHEFVCGILSEWSEVVAGSREKRLKTSSATE